MSQAVWNGVGASQPGSRFRRTTDWRRWLQLALAATWVFDGLLQYQTFMFTTGFSAQLLAPTAAGNPGWISDSIHWAADVIASNPVAFDAGFGTVQIAIGLALAWRPSVKAALSVSIVWSLLVWWFGEGLGGLLTGGAAALTGAPGAVLLYLVLAVLLWPTTTSSPAPFVAAGLVGPGGARAIWVTLWVGLAALNVQPANLTPGGVHAMEAGMAQDQPGWLAALITAFTRASAHSGILLTVLGTIILALIGMSALFPSPILRGAVVAAVVVAAFIWVIGEALGGVYGGRGTDVNSGPLLALIALAYWPTHGPFNVGQTA